MESKIGIMKAPEKLGIIARYQDIFAAFFLNNCRKK